MDEFRISVIIPSGRFVSRQRVLACSVRDAFILAHVIYISITRLYDDALILVEDGYTYYYWSCKQLDIIY